MPKNLLILILCVISMERISSQQLERGIKRDVALNYSVTHVIYSETVQDSFYIFVKLPKNYSTDLNKIIKRINSRNPNYIHLEFRAFQNGVHFSTPSEALVYGLLYIFK